ncbi:MAG: serine dehydratase subunit alpha family protein [Clostridia bacterium]|nr:serine dehydratase subunit alpha family protein [Clostridia bacterium]
MKKELIYLLEAEVKPAMGCTEPVAVTLAVAKARVIGGHETIDEIQVEVSPNIYKNGLSVGIPKSDEVGILKAAAIGAVTGNPDLGLKIYESIHHIGDSDEHVIHKIKVSIADTDEKIWIKVNMKSVDKETTVIIQGMHQHFSYISHNGEVLVDHQIKSMDASFDIRTLTIKDILNEVENAAFESVSFLMEGLEMNAIVSKAGLENKLGLGVGYNTKFNMDKGLLGDDLANRAMCYTAAASDARMSGISLPVMSSNGSGNNGLTAILPLYAYDEFYNVPKEKMAKALALSHLINCYIKAEIGRLSALCSCGISAATGASAAITWLMGGDYDAISGTIQNMIANLSGMICDGAKNSCALKLATSASIGVKSALWSLSGTFASANDGIIGRTVEESILNLGVLSREGMQLTDQTILKIMQSMQ